MAQDKESAKPPRDADTRSAGDVMFALADRPVGLGFVDTKTGGHDRQAVQRIDTFQSLYLTASGTLTQFNAIMVAAQTTVFTASVDVPLKAVIGASLFLHIAAALLLCWAARPVGASTQSFPDVPAGLMARIDKGDRTAMQEVVSWIDAQERAFSYQQAMDLAIHTAKLYRRGWRTSMCAITLSAVSFVAFLLQAAGIEWSVILQRIR